MKHSDKNPGQDKAKHIFINGRQVAFEGDTITYTELVALANPTGVPQGVLFSIMYTGPNIADGSVAEGASINIKNGMKFDVSLTNKS